MGTHSVRQQGTRVETHAYRVAVSPCVVPTAEPCPCGIDATGQATSMRLQTSPSAFAPWAC